MSNSVNWILHTSGADTNGGGYTDDYAGTWSAVLNSGSAVDAITGGTTSDNGGGKVRITKAGQFDGAAVGMMAYFSATNYTAGHYVIIAVDASDNYVDLNCAYVDAQTDAVVNVGGALLNPATAMALCTARASEITGGSWSVTDVDGGSSTSKLMKITNTGLFATYHDNTVAYYPHAEDGQVFINFSSGPADGFFVVHAMDDDSVTIERAYVSSGITSLIVLPKSDRILVCPGTYSITDNTCSGGGVGYETGNTSKYLMPEYKILGVNATAGAELDDQDTWPVFQAVDQATPCSSAGSISDNGGYIKVTFVTYNPSTAGVVAGDWCFIDWSGTDSAPYVDGRFQIRSVASDSVTLETAYANPSGKTVTALYWGNWNNAGTLGVGALGSLGVVCPMQTSSTTYYSKTEIRHLTVDANSKAHAGIKWGGSITNYVIAFLMDVEIKNAVFAGIYSISYCTISQERNLYLLLNVISHDSVRGYYGTSRPVYANRCKFYANTTVGFFDGTNSTLLNCLFYDNGYGLQIANIGSSGRYENCTFCNNTTADLYYYDSNVILRQVGFENCLFYNTVASTKHVLLGFVNFHPGYVEFINCCLNLTGGDRVDTAIALVMETNSQTLTDSPFVSISGASSTWDLRLNPQATDIDMLMDPITGRICGALGFKELDLPALDAILTSDTLMGDAGHYYAPATSIVKDGEMFGVDNAEEGTYAGGGGGGGLLQGNKRGNKQ